jgi:hypothetical protein
MHRSAWAVSTLPFIDQSASVTNPDIALREHCQLVTWVGNGTEIAFTNLGPEVYKVANGGIALFAIEKHCLHFENYCLVEFGWRPATCFIPYQLKF